VGNERTLRSRTINDVTLKDGEAALLWFRQVLSSPTTSP
jgi:hypothetical protein